MPRSESAALVAEAAEAVQAVSNAAHGRWVKLLNARCYSRSVQLTHPSTPAKMAVPALDVAKDVALNVHAVHCLLWVKEYYHSSIPSQCIWVGLTAAKTPRVSVEVSLMPLP